MRRIRLAAGAWLAALILVALISPGTLPGAALASSSTTPVQLYFLVDGQITAVTRAIPSTPAIANETTSTLFAGPLVNELAIGLRTALPTELASSAPVTLDSKTRIATVSLPSIFTGDSRMVEARRTAQIVYTLTQFSTIGSVNFVIDGKAYKPVDGAGKRASGAVSRKDYEALVPAILIESVSGDNPAHVTGTANTFEAEFSYALYDANNKQIAKGIVMATSGSGTRGTFAVDIPYSVKTAQTGTLVAFELSAKDGSVINLVARQVGLKPK